MKIAVVIPAYNEEISIKEVILSFHNELPNAYIYVIDNNSSDNTANIAHKTMKSIDCKGGLLFEPRQGKARAISKAFLEIDADYFIMVDGDMTYPASEVHDLLTPVISGHADMVVGDRHGKGDYKKKNQRLFHNFGNVFVRKLINFLFNSNLNDILSGLRVFNRKFVKLFPILSHGFALETELTLHALDKGFRILEIPIKYYDRPAGSHSKLNTYKDGIKVIKIIFEIFKNYRPFVFFTFFALIFFLAGVLAGLPVLIEFFKTGYILHVPLAILATGLMIFFLVAMAIALILDTVVKNHRFMYALKLLEYSEADIQRVMELKKEDEFIFSNWAHKKELKEMESAYGGPN